MDDYIKRKYFGMFDEDLQEPEQTYRPNINDTPRIEIDKRQYKKTADRIITPSPPQNNTTNNIPNISPYSSPQKKVHINGKSIGEFIKDIIYYNPQNPIDPGNFADGAAIGTYLSQKYGEGIIEKVSIFAGVTYLSVKAKAYLHENFKDK